MNQPKNKKKNSKKSEYSSYYRDFNSIMYIKKHNFKRIQKILGKLDVLKTNLSNLFEMYQFVEIVKLNHCMVSKLKISHWERMIRNPEIIWLNINQ